MIRIFAMALIFIVGMAMMGQAFTITQDEYQRDTYGEDWWANERCMAKKATFEYWMVLWENTHTTAAFNEGLYEVILGIRQDGAPRFAEKQWAYDMLWAFESDLTVGERTETIYNECFARGY